MIAPDMATMLSYVFTDAPIALGRAADDAVEVGRALVQRDHRRQRHLDLRHADDLRHRGGRGAPRIEDAVRSARGRLPTRARQAPAQSRPPGRARRRRARASSSRSMSRARRRRKAAKRIAMSIANSPLVKTAVRRRGRQLGPRRHGGRQGGREGRARQARHLVRQDPRRPRGLRDPGLRRGRRRRPT